MSESKENPLRTHLNSLEETNELNKKLLEAAQSKAVFGEPIEHGEYTLIPAAEVFTAVGVAYGFGSGGGGPRARAAAGEMSDGDVDPDTGGGGGGGGGTSSGRPVAVISVGPDGVEVEPIVDVTKIGLALLTTIGSMGLMFLRMKRKK